MLVVLAFALVAGTLTVLSPCTLPVLPLLVGSGAPGGQGRIVGIAAGFATAFVGVTVLFASSVAAAGLTTSSLRTLSAAILAIAGASLAAPALARWMRARLALLAIVGDRMAHHAATRSGLAGGLALGAAIGLIWAPCVGPIMAAVIAAAVSSGPSSGKAVVALVYVAGALLPMTAITVAGRGVLRSAGSPAARERIQRGFGVAMVATAIVVAAGLDVPMEAGISTLLPDGWGSALVAVEDQPVIQEELMKMQPSRASITAPSDQVGARAVSLPAPLAKDLPASVQLEDLGEAPELRGISAWINSSALTLAGLRGKVVLVHFWTFGCINCQHVQPYVKAWFDRYAAAGLVVIGVHTPELSFERDLGNVRRAVADDGVRFPVAVDPGYETWDAYQNHYWPAFYFVDREGRIRHTHFGEGDYAESEQVIRELLAQGA